MNYPWTIFAILFMALGTFEAIAGDCVRAAVAIAVAVIDVLMAIKYRKEKR